LLTTVAKNVTAFGDNSVVNGNTYTYHVFFYRTTHDFHMDPDGVVRDHPTTASVDALPDETVPVDLDAPVLSATLLKGNLYLSWNAVADSRDNYFLFRSINGAPFTSTYLATLPNNVTTYTDTSVENGKNYRYYVYASNDAGASPNSNTVTVNVELEAPELTAQLDKGMVKLNWSAVAESSGLYFIYRAVDGAAFNPNAYYTYVANNVTSFTDNNVVNGKSYSYYVIASNDAGASGPSNTESVSVQLAPPRLQLSAVSYGHLLQWNANPEATGIYLIYRAVDGAAFNPNQYLTTVSNSTTQFGDSSVSSGHRYAYYVVATNNAGGSPPSNIETGEPSPVEPNTKARPPYQCSCQKIGPVPGGDSAPGAFDPVNVATGGESYEPDPDLVSYNPTGPQAFFQRIGRGNQGKRGYGSPGLPIGWVHNYDVVIEGSQSPSAWTEGLRFGFPNGANEALTPLVNGSGVPTGEFTTDPGVPYFAQGVPSATVGRWQSITLTWKDQSRWVFTPYGTGRLYALTRIYDRLGHSLALYYTAATRCVTSVRNADTNATLLSFAYSGNGMLASVSDAYSRKVTYTTGVPTGLGVVALQSVSQVVATSVTTPPTHWAFGYEPRLGAGTVPRPFLSTITVPSPTGTGTSTATIIYDAQDRVSVLTDGTGNSRTFSYGAGTTTIEDRDSLGTLARTYQENFDSNRRGTGATLVGGSTTVTAYDDSGNPWLPTSVTTPDNKTVTLTYDQFGNLLTSTTPRGVTTTYTYSYTNFRLGRLVSVQEGSRPASTLTYYEPSGVLQSVTGPSPTGSGTVTYSFTYDALGNVLTATGPGNNAASTSTVTFNYTQDGAYTQAAAVGQPVTATDPLGRVTHFRYDSRGRLTSSWDPTGNTSTAQYNVADQATSVYFPATGQSGVGSGRTDSVFLYPGGPLIAAKLYDESGALTRQVDYTYDADGRVLQVAGSTEPARFEYDGAGRMVRRYDGNNNLQTEYVYDAQGRLGLEQRPQGGGVFHGRAYDYDVAGRVIRRTDGVVGQTLGQIIVEYAYGDPDGLLTAVNYLNATGRNVTLGYDSYGRLSTRQDGTGTRTYTYGDLDQILSVTTAYTGLSSQALTYGYYADGSRASLSTPAGGFSYQYNAAGQPTTLSNPLSESTSWTYLNNGWLSTQTLGNGVTSTYGYTQLGQLKSLVNRTAGSTVLSQFDQMVHDGAGNRLGVTATVPTQTALSGAITYSYDLKDQLLGESSGLSGGFANAFNYDAAGNPTAFKGNTRTYDAQNRRTGTGFAYDVQGNPTLYQGTGITYTPEGEATQFGGLLSADYTFEGLRAWKENGTTGVRTYFLYDGTTPVVELTATGSVHAVNTFGANGLVSRSTATGSTFYVFDERGNTSVRLDASGSVLSSHAADAFGGTLSLPSGGGADDPYAGYGAQWGYYRDAETGLYLCTYRYYDASEGRWLTPDPIGYAGGGNLYGYVSNNPANATDPSGLAPVDAPGYLIYAYWFHGSGAKAAAKNPNGWADFSTPAWGKYMMANPDLANATRAFLGSPLSQLAKSLKTGQTATISCSLTADSVTIGGGGPYMDGYTLLHGPDDAVGGYQISVTATKRADGGLNVNGSYAWNDNIDANSKYDPSHIVAFFKFSSRGRATDYRIRIGWSAQSVYYPFAPSPGRRLGPGVGVDRGWPFK
jgi:RHS repeat-associated protein